MSKPSMDAFHQPSTLNVAFRSPLCPVYSEIVNYSENEYQRPPVGIFQSIYLTI